MGMTIEEAKDFISESEKCRRDWAGWAARSDREIKKRSHSGKLWHATTDRRRREGKFPLWFSTLKIRQSIVFSRRPEPVGEDTSQDGLDTLGATAALMKERLADGMIRLTNYFETMKSCRDSLLLTNMAVARGTYRCKDQLERVREYIQVIPDPTGENPQFMDEAGEPVLSEEIFEDEQGFFIERDELVDVKEESVELEYVCPRTDFYPDPDINRWEQARRVAFATTYSREAFREIFGTRALMTLSDQARTDTVDTDKQKRANKIRVFELHDDYESDPAEQVKWFAENGSDFIKPKKLEERGYEESEDWSGLYNLPGLFPMTRPAMVNNLPDEFYPNLEYYQLVDLLEDINVLFTRMIKVARAIRAKLMYDSSIAGLQEALHEDKDGDTIGVANLAAQLNTAGGDMLKVARYLPIDTLIQSLEQLYRAFDQRLALYFQLTGMSDLLRGLTDGTQRTFGEQQMKERWALNQVAEPQACMATFAAENLDLMCNIALNCFSDETLAKYIVPRTLAPEHQRRYAQALTLLRSDAARFRVKLATDSTVAIREEYQKEAAKELVNALTTALEKTAETGSKNPALVIPELHALKYLVKSFRSGKLFQAELTAAIDRVIEEVQSKETPPDPKLVDAQAKAEIEQRRVVIDEFKAQVDAWFKRESIGVKQQQQRFDEFFSIEELKIRGATTNADLNERWATEERLQRQEAREAAEAQMEAMRPPAPAAPAAPQVVVVPAPPQPGPTIVVPQPEPQTIVQPVIPL